LIRHLIDQLIRLMMRTALLSCLAALCVAISACSSSYVPNVLRPYRPDVQQGNIVTKDMVEQLRPGMTRDQVRFLLGTPMLTDIFHQDRWDYTYYLRRKSGETQIRKLSIEFAEGKLNKFQSDAMPAEPLADSLILGQKPSKPAVPVVPAAAAPLPSSDPVPAPATVPAPDAPKN
jgi:outer membrane protein assembly factor BamE